MKGKVLYLPVATLPPELPPDPLCGCKLWADRPLRRRLRRCHLSRRERQGRCAAGLALVGAAYVAACVLWTPALWLLPTAIALGVGLYGSYYY